MEKVEFKKAFMAAFAALAAFILIAAIPLGAAETENGVGIEVGRVLRGSRTGAKYYGFAYGTIILPSAKGGILAFNLWNDTPMGGTSVLNYFVTEIAGQKITIESYATRNQILEPYAEEPGWGAGGIQRVRLAIPPGVDRIQFNSQGSETGIEISELKFFEGLALPSGAYAADQVRSPGEPVVEVGRILTGKNTGRKFYGFADGIIHLPHAKGGYLSFKFWNDQAAGHNWVLNTLNLTIGTRKETIRQYSTSMDLEEFFREFDNQYGPGGGGEVSIQLPEGIRRIQFNNAGSMTGLELSDIQFSSGLPVAVSFKPREKVSSRVLIDMGRIFTGKTTGRKYYGYSSGTVILPDNKGGTLYFTLWNDHPGDAPLITNSLVVKAGDRSETFRNTSTNKEKLEVFAEEQGWGPSGGRQYSFQVPSGVGLVELRQGQSETGIELSDLRFSGN